MEDFKCPLTEADWQLMRDICARCDQRRPFIAALNDLEIDTHQLEQENEKQQRFCQACERLRAEGKL